MPFNVNTNKGDIPSPQVIPANTVIRHARDSGNQNAQRALGVTLPVLRIDQAGLEYEQRRAQGGLQFRFSTGTLRLALRQSVYIANTLSNCEQKIIEAHEMDHVRDNQELMDRIAREIRNHRALQNIFNNPSWRPRGEFKAVQRTIQSTVDEIFQRLVREAVQNRDTQAEYDAIQRRIDEKCGRH